MQKMKLIAIAFALLLTAPMAFAQVQAVSIGGGLAMPGGSFGNFAGTGLGGNVRAFYLHDDLDNILLTANIGFYRFGSKEYRVFGFGSGVDVKYTLIPVMSGGRYYFGKKEEGRRFWAGAEVGFHIYSVSFSDDNGASSSLALAGQTDFALQPMAGIDLGSLDVYAYYTIADFNYLGVQASFKLPVGGN